MTARSYWDTEFAGNPQHHSAQNGVIARDLIRMVDGTGGIQSNIDFRRALMSPRIIEIGCGTGEFCGRIAFAFEPDTLLGTDLSEEAVKLARGRYPRLEFEVLDVTKRKPKGKWDLCIASNVLEHFRDPHAVIRRVFKFAPLLLAVVPLGQQQLDEWECEGGAGHVFSFDHQSFIDYRIVAHFTFQTDGWQSDSSSKQWAVLLEAKP